MDPLYRAPTEEFSPGDIFSETPSLYLRDSGLEFLRRRTGKGGRAEADLYAVANQTTSPIKPFNPLDDEAIARVQTASAVVLTHGCEIDGRPRACLVVALARPIRTVPTANDQENIRRGATLSFLWLPPNDEPPMEESYIDFSRLTSLRREALRPEDKILSASEELTKALFLGVTRYFTRWDIPEETLTQLALEAQADVNAGSG